MTTTSPARSADEKAEFLRSVHAEVVERKAAGDFTGLTGITAEELPYLFVAIERVTAQVAGVAASMEATNARVAVLSERAGELRQDVRAIRSDQ